MAVAKYDGAIWDLSKVTSFESLVHKSAIITGSASGLGKAYAEAFVKAGSFVTVADYDEETGKQTAAQLGSNAQFVKCDVRSWDDQVAVFEAAVTNSPDKSCDIVISNAGIIVPDDMFKFDDPSQPPIKPDLRTLEVNLLGTAYTIKLAIHYFRRQSLDRTRDRCLILKSSLSGYVDQPGAPQYNASKWGVRGFLRSYRRDLHNENIRVNLVAPWYVRTPILSDATVEFLQSKGVNFATMDDAASTMLRIAAMKEVNGRSFGIVPKEMASLGCLDLEHDDYQEGDFMKGWQDTVLETAQSVVDLA
ncbi:unnamed protein product [Clonostachys solani]|uniref:5'-hydroxyaverantin dehydrogenase n=1 Tax=Clonostachys solani TaxID=160281 RepID=A0A9N9ZKR5_9HYPO|nr:unnamed protein product [Clonostachys solani]